MAQVDTSIYSNLLRAPKTVEEYDQEAQSAQANKLSLLLQKSQYDQNQRGIEDDNAFRSALGQGGDYNDTAVQQRLIQASPAKGMAFVKNQADTRKAQSDAIKSERDAEKDRIAIARSQIELLGQVAGAAKDQASYTQGLQMLQAQGIDVSQIPPQFDPQYVSQALQQAVTAKDQLEEVWKAKKFDLDERQFGETVRNNKAQNAVSQGNLAVARGNLGLSRERLAFDQAQPKGQYDAERGVLVDPRTGEAKPVTMGGKPIAPKAKSGPMSVTLQKELIESDDNIQQSASAISALKKAKTINEKAYSGYGASARATLMSNLGGTESANATVELDNLIGQQALSSMKSIFGGNPTEGERAILLDLQASSSKTPAQRTAILDRAIKAAEVRAKFAASKAQSIRNGKYLTEGAPVPQQDEPTAPTGAKFLGFE